MNPTQVLWLIAVAVFPLLVLILRLLWLLRLRERQIALLRGVMKAADKLALSYSVSSNDVAGVRAQSIPPTSANTSGPHEATGSQKSAKDKTPPYSID